MLVNVFLILFSGAISGVLTGSSYLPISFIPGTLQMQLVRLQSQSVDFKMHFNIARILFHIFIISRSASLSLWGFAACMVSVLACDFTI